MSAQGTGQGESDDVWLKLHEDDLSSLHGRNKAQLSAPRGVFSYNDRSSKVI